MCTCTHMCVWYYVCRVCRCYGGPKLLPTFKSLSYLEMHFYMHEIDPLD